MRILFSLTYYTPYVSGLTLYVKRLTEALAGNGHQISVISFQHEKRLQTNEAIDEVKVYRARPLSKISKGFLSFDWILLSWKLVRQNDTVVINLPQFEGIVPALLAKLFGKRVITIYHCEVILPPSLPNKTIEWVLRLSHFVTLCLSDFVITYTEDFGNHSPVLSHFRGKIKYIYPPIPKPKVNKRVQKMIRDKIARKIGSDLKSAQGLTLIIGVAARLAAEKGIEYLFEAIPMIDAKLQNPNIKSNPKSKVPNYILKPITYNLKPEFKIIIAGSLDPVGEQKYKQKMLKLVEKYKNYVVFLGELNEEDMGSFYSLLDVLVLPSVNSTEAFGMVQVEAMMMGVPVVSSDLPGVRVPIQKTGMGKLVPLKNSEKLAESIVEVLIHNRVRPLTPLRSDPVIDIVMKEFSFEKTIAFYQKLLK